MLVLLDTSAFRGGVKQARGWGRIPEKRCPSSKAEKDEAMFAWLLFPFFVHATVAAASSDIQCGSQCGLWTKEGKYHIVRPSLVRSLSMFA